MRRVQCGLKDVILPSKWEALLNNLGHTCRKMKKYEEALNYHQQVKKKYPYIIFLKSLFFLAYKNKKFYYKNI